jgi:hypothetical protein
MAPVLTLHQGDEKADYVPHPIEVARRLLVEAADDESDSLASALRRSRRLRVHGPPPDFQSPREASGR